MHIILAIFGLLAAGAFWWYRVKYMSEAANEVVDQVGKVRGHFRRKSLKKKADLSPVTAIDDPVIAAATVIIAIAGEDRPVTEAAEARIREIVEPIAGSDEKLVEAVTYAKWATDQVDDVPTIIDRVGAFLSARLTENEKEELVRMTHAAIPQAERNQLFPGRIDRLRRKLGLVGTL